MATEGLRPGCDDERALPKPRLDAVLDEMEALVSFCPIWIAAEDGSVGDGEPVPGGAEAFDRLCEMVPITGDELMSCNCADGSDRTDNVEVPLDLGFMKLEELGDGGTRSVAISDAGPGPGIGEGNAGNGESLLNTRGVSGTRFWESVAASFA